MGFLTFGNSTQCKNKQHVNQDKFGSIIVKTPSGKEVIVAAVADGVSMCYKGEIASYNVIRYILAWGAEYFSNIEYSTDRVPGEFGDVVEKINAKLNNYSNARGKKKVKENYGFYSSTTLSCLISDGDTIMYFSIGDSSIYEFKQFATVNIMGSSHSNKHKDDEGRLISYIGGIEGDNIDIRYIESRFDNSAVYFICTDGMTGKINFNIEKNDDFRRFNQELLAASTRKAGIDILQEMTNYVVDKGETDDITALGIKKN